MDVRHRLTQPLDLRRVPSHRLVVPAVATLVHAVAYGIPNRLPIHAPVALPLIGIDRAVPFLPVTAWIYWSDYLLLFAAYQWTSQPNRFIRAFASTLVAAVAIHLAFPTVYPRELFPIPASTDRVTLWAFLHFRSLDAATSCLPSLHVALALVAALSVRGRPHATALTLWCLLIAISTLTTKQHYLWDVLAGAVLGAITWVVSRANWGPATGAQILRGARGFAQALRRRRAPSSPGGRASF